MSKHKMEKVESSNERGDGTRYIDADITGDVAETHKVAKMTIYRDMLGGLMDRALETENQLIEMRKRMDDMEKDITFVSVGTRHNVVWICLGGTIAAILLLVWHIIWG